MKLNLGCGDTPIDGYENLDRKSGQEVYPLTYPDNSVSEIRASHVLEHFGHGLVVHVVKEWCRALKPGGVLKIAVPNLEWIARQYLDGQPINVQGYLMGGQVDGNDYHGAAFDKESLIEIMRVCGLQDIREWTSDIQDCASLDVSLNLMGVKPGPLPKVKIGCAMSVPRLGFQDNFFCWANALLPLGIVPLKYDGAFWGQCLERVMADLLDNDFILTIDYDSIFTRTQVETLIRTMHDNPEIDALAALQIRRKTGMPLLHIKGRTEIPVAEFSQHDTVKVDSAHFGLTLIRCESLKKLPHPWFLGVPDDHGTWGEKRTDDDIYFWQKWAEAGNSIHVANRVPIGHAELMVTWPSRDFSTIYQHPSDFYDNGTPKGVWQ